MDCLIHELDARDRDVMSLNEQDRAWIKNEISSQITSANRDSGASIRNIEIDVANIKGQLAAPKKTHHPLAIGLISVAGTLFAAYLGWMGYSTNQHGNTLASIKQSLLGLGITISANTPGEPDSQAQAQASIAEARKTKVRLSEPVIKQAGQSFIDAAAWSPKAWDVALDFVAYQSLLNQENVPKYHWGQLSNSPAQIDWPSDGTKAFVTNETKPCTQGAMQAHIVGKTAYFSAVPENPNDPCAALLRFFGGKVTLDGSYYIDTTFENMRIIYRGGPVRLEKVTFVNCTFVLTNTEATRNLASSLFASPRTSFNR